MLQSKRLRWPPGEILPELMMYLPMGDEGSIAEAFPSVPDALPGLLRFLDAKRRGTRLVQRIPDCEKLIFLATKTEAAALEFVALERGLTFRKCCDHEKRKYFDLGEVGGERILAVRTEMGPFAEAGSAARSIWWRNATGARAVISVGMAFGALPDRQRIGDILIAEAVLPYDIRVVRTGEHGEPVVDYSEVSAYPAHADLLLRFQQRRELPAWRGRVWSGALLSGAARIHCAAFRDELAQKCGDKSSQVVGGDMESVGLLSASSDRSDPCWIVVKAISDFADRHRDEVITKARPFACYSAAHFVLSALLGHEE